MILKNKKMEIRFKNNAALNKWVAFTDGQAKNRALWYMASLVFQGVLCLPIPAALVFYFNASPICTGITVLLFFSTMVAGMCGSGIRTIIFFILLSLMVNLCLLAYYVF